MLFFVVGKWALSKDGKYLCCFANPLLKLERFAFQNAIEGLDDARFQRYESQSEAREAYKKALEEGSIRLL